MLPPMVLFALLTPTPTGLGWLVPAALMPMKLPATRLPVAETPVIETPAWLLKPMVLAAAAVLPPIVLPDVLSTRTPIWLPCPTVRPPRWLAMIRLLLV